MDHRTVLCHYASYTVQSRPLYIRHLLNPHIWLYLESKRWPDLVMGPICRLKVGTKSIRCTGLHWDLLQACQLFRDPPNFRESPIFYPCFSAAENFQRLRILVRAADMTEFSSMVKGMFSPYDESLSLQNSVICWSFEKLHQHGETFQCSMTGCKIWLRTPYSTLY